MKQMTLMLAAALVTSGAMAWTVAITTNASPTIVVPPAIEHRANITEYRERSPTNAVTIGQFRRVGRTLVVAATTGTTATNAVAPTIPTTGRSAADGTVYWMRVPNPDEWSRIVLQPYITSGATVYFTNSDSDGITEATSLAKIFLEGNKQAIYGRASVTNCSVSVLPIK